ncbi:AMP-binding protein [Streptomyces sp. NA04227]|uniref:class I adenylate-forming enzyme family protein n=1 Tax=Streptomyces sp. NA04227 TaxID=2742136 RepID=UPI001592906B|nr:AMP-binding protein [Streptomyces sp. NA04227]QKW06898.1 AMP-binding protein [Streptomyces sp. NA04227]
MWMAHFITRNRQLRPDAMALADADRQVTWRELDERTDSLATALVDRGLAKGDRIAVSSPNRIEVLELYIAAAKAGVIVCPVNHSFPAPEVEHVVGNSGPLGVFAEQSVLDRLGASFGEAWQIALDSPAYEEMASVPARRLPLPLQDDIFAILHTSATTGRAKGVVVTHRSISACYTALAAEASFGPDDVMINPCPLFHGSTVIGLALLAAGGALVLHREFQPQRFLADTEKYRATRAFLVPSMVRFAMRAKAFETTDLSSLNEIMFGGAPITEELLRESLDRFPCHFRNIYGITEGGGPIATTVFNAPAEGVEDPTWELRLRTAGHMLPGCHIEVQDKTGARVPDGEIGEVCVRGDGMMLRYWNNPEATEGSIRDGWLRTGDVGYADAEGYIFLVDRLNDVLIRGGQNVYPAEIERVISGVPGVQDVAVVGVPDEEWGEVPIAFVATGEQPPTKAVLVKTCVAELASYKRPVRYEFIEEIPRSAAGKILRRVLRDGLAEEKSKAAAAEPARAQGA